MAKLTDIILGVFFKKDKRFCGVVIKRKCDAVKQNEKQLCEKKNCQKNLTDLNVYNIAKFNFTPQPILRACGLRLSLPKFKSL